MNPHLWWYVARSSGIVAWTLLSASVWLGLALSTRALGRRPTAAWLLDLHRGLGGLAVVFTGLHMASLVLDGAVEFTVVDLVVPLASDWRPGAVAWGVVATYLLVAVEVSSLLRRRLSTRVWRTIHLASLPLAVVASVHMLQAGTDADSVVLSVLLLLTLLASGALALVRIAVLRDRTRHRAARTAAGRSAATARATRTTTGAAAATEEVLARPSRT